MAFFIVFEGGDGSGKTTQVRNLYSRIRRRQTPVRVVHEPGSTVLGESIRRLLSARRKTGSSLPPIVPEAELFLFEASRAQLVGEVIRPSLRQGTSVICDRYVYSTVAYQGYGRNLEARLIKQLNEAATGGLHPDLVVYLDVPPEAALQRKTETTDMGRFEKEELAFHQRVRRGYMEQAAAEPHRWFVVDALLPTAQVSRLIWERVEGLIKDRM
ncbi:MAG: dTMP kinase [Chloroflexi bacterium]|nr:dTMP kinase [Chloroflexota bacterium]